MTTTIMDARITEEEKWRQNIREQLPKYKNNFASIEIQKKIYKIAGITDGELVEETTPLQIWIYNTIDKIMLKFKELHESFPDDHKLSDVCCAVGFSSDFIEKQTDINDDMMGHFNINKLFEILFDRIIRDMEEEEDY